MLCLFLLQIYNFLLKFDTFFPSFLFIFTPIRHNCGEIEQSLRHYIIYYIVKKH